MRNLAINEVPRRCRCGALCGAKRTRCRKCHDRIRWYRRKAWRINPIRHAQGSHTLSKEKVITA